MTYSGHPCTQPYYRRRGGYGGTAIPDLRVFFHDTLRLDSEEITFPVKLFESVFDLLTNVPRFYELSINDRSKMKSYLIHVAGKIPSFLTKI